MISTSTAVQNVIKQALEVNAVPRVTIEWNQNRYATVSTVDNWGSSNEATNAYDLDVFPVKSITEPLRPTAGILIGKTHEGITTSGYTDVPGSYRTYISSPTSKYKYWTSQVESSATISGSAYPIDSTKASPYIIYGSQVWTNKIYLCFETSYAKPVAYNIDVTSDGGTTWTTVATNIVPNSDGTVVLYRQANNTWGASTYWANPTQLNGIRVVVSSMSVATSFLNLIEMGLRLEDDVSPYLISYSVGFDMSEADFTAPMGVISSNTGSVVLSNVDGRFNNDAPTGTDTTPLYRGLIDANAKVTIDLGIDATAYGGSKYEYVRQATMFVETWGSDNEQSTLEIKDASKYLQELKPNKMLMQDVTPGNAIWRILDSVGFNSYKYSKAAAESPNTIDFYWTNSDTTVWDHVQEICKETQAGAYFDAFGVLQIKTQQAAFDFTQIGSPDWTVDYALNGSKQPDLVSLNESNLFEANTVTIHYKPTALATDIQHRPIQEVVWQPSEDVVLRSAALAQDMTSSQMYFYIGRDEATYWPFDGMANIRGELITYKGKEYRYVNTSGVWTSTVIYTTDDKLHIDNDLSSATLGYQNYFTGKMIITQRGYDWTTAAAHDATIQSWLNEGPAFGSYGGTQTVWTGGITHLRSDSIMRVTGRSTWDSSTLYELPHSQVWAQSPNNIGTRFRFPSTPKGRAQAGGIFLHSNSAMNSMYCIDIISTPWRDSSGQSRGELRIFKRTGGVLTTLITQDHLIAEDNWYDLDVTVSGSTISVFINGLLAMNVTDSSLTPTAKCGLYTRGYTVMDFEYFYYASGANWPDIDTDNSSYLDLIRGGYYSDQNYKDGFYRLREARRTSGNRTITYKQRYNQRFFDEFGILVHEVRPFTVTFDKGPVTYSDLYFSNQAQAVCLDYVGTPFGATFTLANASRDNAVLQGDDTLTFPGSSVKQVLMITGRTVQQQAEKTLVKTNDAAIRARGEISLDISSDWIQSDSHADALGDWIVNNWGTPADEVDVEIFGNPLPEIGDLIGVNYPARNMTSTTHNYFVVKISHDFSSSGLSTSLSLRRARNSIY